jgi:hypothetical protein
LSPGDIYGKGDPSMATKIKDKPSVLKKDAEAPMALMTNGTRTSNVPRNGPAHADLIAFGWTEVE